MAKTGWIETFNARLLDERGAWLRLQTYSGVKSLTDKRERIRTDLKEIGQTGNIGLILATEKAILENDLEFYANSPEMVKSLQNGIGDLEITEALLPKVADPDRYRLVDEDCQRSKNRIGPLPRDEARQFFRSHDARLVNMKKSRLDDAEKAIIDVRKQNIRIAEKAYIQKQEQALGIVRKNKGPEQGLSR